MVATKMALPFCLHRESGLQGVVLMGNEKHGLDNVAVKYVMISFSEVALDAAPLSLNLVDLTVSSSGLPCMLRRATGDNIPFFTRQQTSCAYPKCDSRCSSLQTLQGLLISMQLHRNHDIHTHDSCQHKLHSMAFGMTEGVT